MIMNNNIHMEDFGKIFFFNKERSTIDKCFPLLIQTYEYDILA